MTLLNDGLPLTATSSSAIVLATNLAMYRRSPSMRHADYYDRKNSALTHDILNVF
jgi:hypothetical protein